MVGVYQDGERSMIIREPQMISIFYRFEFRLYQSVRVIVCVLGSDGGIRVDVSAWPRPVRVPGSLAVADL